MTRVSAKRYVNCPFSAVIDYAETAIREKPDFTVSPVPAVAASVDVSTLTVDDHSDTVRRHDALQILWSPKDGPFPSFNGSLTARTEKRGSWLRIDGTYEPPLGFFGRIFDLFIGRAIAWLTLRRLLDDIGATIEARWEQFRLENP